MPFTGAMRAWALGQVILVIGAALAAGLGLAQRPGSSPVGTPLAILVGGVAVFFVPLVLALWVPSIRRYALFWAISIVPAVLWVPAIPAVFLRGGPDLGTPAGVGLAAAAIVGTVLVTVGGLISMVEGGRLALPDARPDGPLDEPPGQDVIVAEPARLPVAEVPVEGPTDEPAADEGADGDDVHEPVGSVPPDAPA